jgi:hypothetical protein
MPEAKHIYGTVKKGGTTALVARVVGTDGNPLEQANFAGDTSSSSGAQCDPPASYSVFLLNDQDEDDRTVVSGHDANAINVSDVIFDTLQTDNFWENDDGEQIDATGYNFRHTPDICPNPAFAIAGRHYLVEYRLQTLYGEVKLVTFVLRCI